MSMQSGAGGGGIMGAGNPVVGGTTIRIPAIQSPNYVAGVSGWIVRANGTAEFQGLTITGGTVVMGGSGAILMYSGTPAAGNLVLSIAPVAGTDAFGNAYPKGESILGTNGALVALHTDATIGSGTGAALTVTPPTAANWNAGYVNGNHDSSTPQNPYLTVTSPTDKTIGVAAQLILQGSNTSTSTQSGFALLGRNSSVQADTLLVGGYLGTDVAVTLTGTLSVSGSGWANYTPTFTSTGGTLGNGTLTGRYWQLGKLVTVVVKLTCGSTTNLGTTTPLFTLPVTAANTNANGAALLTNAGVALYNAETRHASTTEVAISYTTSPSASLSQTQPFTWGTGDTVTFTHTYEAA